MPPRSKIRDSFRSGLRNHCGKRLPAVEGVRASTRAGGWSEATLIADCNCSSPSLAIAQGVAHLALQESSPFEQSGIARTMHATHARGGWSVTEVAAGTAPMLALAPDGRPFILFDDNGNLLLAEWQGEAGGFAVSAGPGTSSAARYRPSLAFCPDGTLDAIWADGQHPRGPSGSRRSGAYLRRS